MNIVFEVKLHDILTFKKENELKWMVQLSLAVRYLCNSAVHSSKSY